MTAVTMPAPANVLVSPPPGARSIMYRDALNECLKQKMREDPRVFVMGEGIADRGGSYKVTVDLLKEFGPWRCLDTPIAEASFTGAGVGAAITGMRPVVEILFVDFTMLILDQIVNQAAKLNFMSGGRGRVPMVLRSQGGVGNGVAAQHSQSLEAIFYHIPGLKVVMPSTPYDAKGLLRAAIDDDDTVIFLEHKLLYMTEGPVPAEPYTIPLGKGDIKRIGTDCTIIAWSNMLPRSLKAAEELAKEGISCEVVDPRTLTPLDVDLLCSSVRKTEHCVIVAEAVRRGGVASDIASIIQAECFDHLDAPVHIEAGKNTQVPYNLNLEAACVPQLPDIMAAVKKTVYAR